ncbi:MAG: ATP-binding protein [Eubacteriales bacterium]|nr:ATP-binding protein [Eubacteriales bacterium]
MNTENVDIEYKESYTTAVIKEVIRRMIAEAYGDSYEDRRSLLQGLTFETFEKECAYRDIDISTDVKLKNLGLIGDDGLYTNLALLLSDQCPTTSKAALFDGRTKENFQDRREFRGSILKQMDEMNAFLDILNKTKASFHGLLREDQRDYPEAAIREALLNATVHRDYSLGGSSIVNIYDDRIEFISLGGLVEGLSMDAIFLGASLSRNPKMATLFYRMKLIESFGTGIPKIEDLYDDFAKKPEFRTVQGAFRVVLYNRNFEHKIDGQPAPDASGDKEERTILEEADSKGEITRKRVQELLGVGQTTAYKVLTELVDSGDLMMVRAGRKTVYRAMKDSEGIKKDDN